MTRLLLVLVALATTTSTTSAQDGTWISTAAGPFNWSAGTSWSGGTIANGTDNTASFTAGITTNQTVTLDSARTIGNITVTDSAAPLNNLTISGSNILTLDRTTGTPSINVTQLSMRLFINSQITGSDGLTKNGS
ncbi:MAG: hypothetical protein ACRC7O_16475, partial [Fimbriiglobus sp.]